MARLLVIDDDKQIRELLHLVLSRDGHEVREAIDGERGIAAFAEQAADLVIIDLFMPTCGGWETIRT